MAHWNGGWWIAALGFSMLLAIGCPTADDDDSVGDDDAADDDAADDDAGDDDATCDVPAPTFAGVLDHTGAVVSPDALIGHPTVLWFYPIASTAG